MGNPAEETYCHPNKVNSMTDPCFVNWLLLGDPPDANAGSATRAANNRAQRTPARSFAERRATQHAISTRLTIYALQAERAHHSSALPNLIGSDIANRRHAAYHWLSRQLPRSPVLNVRI